MIGDQITDMEFAKSQGLKESCLEKRTYIIL